MLLQSIKLENFRQFRNESIDFADGNNGKNVTIIIGENGTGKTTFAQAFFWCLYGETEFSDKNMLNKVVASELRPGQEAKVQVVLKLKHGDVDYTLIREQIYRKDSSNRIKPDNTVFDIAKKDASGNTSYIKKSVWHPFYSDPALCSSFLLYPTFVSAALRPPVPTGSCKYLPAAAEPISQSRIKQSYVSLFLRSNENGSQCARRFPQSAVSPHSLA